MLCKGIKGLVTVVLRKIFKIIAKKLVFHPFSNKLYLSGTLSVYVEIQVSPRGGKSPPSP